jgi:ATP-binding cassette subfamily F protein 3
MLLLDEPTNHLDIDAREALVQALNQFEGAVVLVSHDPHLVSLVADRLWVIKDGRCAAFDGDVADYRREILDAGRQARREEKKDNGNPPASKKEDRRRRAEMRAAQAALRTAVRDTEKQMEALAGKRDKLAAKLADPKIYEGPTADFAKLAKQKADLDQDLTNAEADWLQAQEALDAEA